MASIALYYPWMHFQDSDWLKLALLSWDRLVRLRPRDVDDRDSELVREIRGETDLLEEITPSDHDLETVARAFFELLGDDGPAADHPAFEALRVADPTPGIRADDEARSLMAPWSNAPDIQLAPPSQQLDDRSLHPVELTWIYCGAGTKMAYQLRQQLVEARLARQVGEADPWVGLHPRLGSVYLAALADTVARHNALSPVTDDPRMHHAVGALDHLAELLGQAVAPAMEDTRAAYVHLTLRAVLKPENLAAVSVSQLTGFRQRYAAELSAFRSHVDSLAAELQQIAAVENPVVAQAHLQALYERTTKPELDELRRALRAFGITSTVGALGLKVDLGAASGTALGTLAVTGGHPTVGTAAVALTIVPYLAGRLKARRQARVGSPAAYLLAMERKLTGSPLRALH